MRLFLAEMPSTRFLFRHRTESRNSLKVLFLLNFAAYCRLTNTYFSMKYAVGLLPLDDQAGYALPNIISTPEAIAPTEDAMKQQAAALLRFHSQPSKVYPLLPKVTNQIMYFTGSQEIFIPAMNQVIAAAATPGSWLVQLPDQGHVSFYKL